MDQKTLTKKSKFISLLLRHQPEKANLVLDSAGWTDTSALLKAIGISQSDLDFIVDNNNKKRFEFSKYKTKIRARQGHSIEDIDLEYKPMVPPDMLFHGTHRNIYQTIMTQGIKKMSRHHVHLSTDTETAKSVGARHGKPIIFNVDSGWMHKDGIEFFKTENGVWLTEFVKPRYISVSIF